MPDNSAARLTALHAYPLEVKPAPYTSPRDLQIVIKNRAVAINPVDWAVQAFGDKIFPWLKYPYLLGIDVAGEVVEVGATASSRFKIGDRVVGHAAGFENGSAEGGFQAYVVLQTNLTSHIPDSMTFEQAAVFPLGLSTATSGLFQTDYLNLQYPTSPAQKPTGLTLLIWGGSTSVGSNAIQLAVAAGYEVISTSSPKNFDYVKSLGASSVFDYNSPTIVPDIVNALKSKDNEHAGALAIGSVQSPGNGAAGLQACLDIVAQCPGTKFVASAIPPPPPEELPKGVGVKFAQATAIKNNDVGDVIYRDFLPKALAAGDFKVAPEPQVVGRGLGEIQKGMDILKAGVSATKIVVSL